MILFAAVHLTADYLSIDGKLLRKMDTDIDCCMRKAKYMV